MAKTSGHRIWWDEELGIAIDNSERKWAEEEFAKRMQELESFYQMAVGREHRMIELKREVNLLSEELHHMTFHFRKDK